MKTAAFALGALVLGFLFGASAKLVHFRFSEEGQEVGEEASWLKVLAAPAESNLVSKHLSLCDRQLTPFGTEQCVFVRLAIELHDRSLTKSKVEKYCGDLGWTQGCSEERLRDAVSHLWGGLLR